MHSTGVGIFLSIYCICRYMAYFTCADAISLCVFLQSEVKRVSLCDLLVSIWLKFENHKGIVHINEILDHLGVNLDSVCVSVGATLSVHVCCHQSMWQNDINNVRVCARITSHNPACSLPRWCVDVLYRDAFNPGVFRTSIKETKTVRKKLVFMFSVCSGSLKKCLSDVHKLDILSTWCIL